MKLSIIGLTLASIVTSGIALADNNNTFSVVEGKWKVVKQECFLGSSPAICPSTHSVVDVEVSDDGKEVLLSLDNNVMTLRENVITVAGVEVVEGFPILANSDDADQVAWVRREHDVVGDSARYMEINFCPESNVNNEDGCYFGLLSTPFELFQGPAHLEISSSISVYPADGAPIHRTFSQRYSLRRVGN